MIKNKEVASRLRSIRKERGEERCMVAHAIGYSDSAIKSIELGNRISLNLVVALSDYYGVSLDYIIKGTGSSEFDILFRRIHDDKKSLAWNVVKSVLATFTSSAE